MVAAPHDATEGPLLPQFYAGRSVLITGATGFVGKVLVERVLATCPHVTRLYLLLRDKRGNTPQERLAQLKQSQVFDGIRERCPEQLDKMSVVTGDITQPRLGLSQETITELREVSLVLHSAATVKLAACLAEAAQHNALVHVSTAFTNSEHRVVEERVYPPPMDPGHLLTVVQALPKHLLDDITPRLVHPKPNTYVFTKAIAESVLEQKQKRHYSVSICRPPVVIAAHRHPVPGWVEGLSGPIGFVVAMGQGLLHAFPSPGLTRAEVIPVDVVADTLMAVCWETASDMCRDVRVYNCSSQENPTRWDTLTCTCVTALRAHPFDRAVWYPFIHLCANRYLYLVLDFLLHIAPLYIAEFLSKIFNIKSKLSLITACHRVQAMNAVLNYFVYNEWHFATDNMRCLRARLTPHDRAIYNLDIKTVKWDEHYVNMVKGVRKYLMHQNDDKMDDARRRMHKLRFVHHIVLLIIFVLSYKFILTIVSALKNIL